MKQTADNDQNELYKDTALDENADIYSKREEKTVKQTWKELDRKGKWQFFKDYIMWKVIAGFAAVAFVIIMVYSVRNSGKKPVLFTAIVDDVLNDQMEEDLTKKLEDMFQVSKKEKVVFDDNFYLNNDGLNRIQVYISSADIDVIIADEPTFTTLAGYGFFDDITQVIGDDMDDVIKSRLYYAKGYLESENVEFTDNSTGKGPSMPYGISLDGCELYDSMRTFSGKPVLGIVANSEHKDNAVSLLKYLTESGSQINED